MCCGVFLFISPISAHFFQRQKWLFFLLCLSLRRFIFRGSAADFFEESFHVSSRRETAIFHAGSLLRPRASKVKKWNEIPIYKRFFFNFLTAADALQCAKPCLGTSRQPFPSKCCIPICVSNRFSVVFSNAQLSYCPFVFVFLLLFLLGFYLCFCRISAFCLLHIEKHPEKGCCIIFIYLNSSVGTAWNLRFQWCNGHHKYFVGTATDSIRPPADYAQNGRLLWGLTCCFPLWAMIH